MSLANNPAFKVAFESQIHSIKFYMPVDIADYHTHRHVAARGLDLYSASGATKELQQAYRAEIKRLCLSGIESKKQDNYMRINTLMDNLDYRAQYPIDEHCAIRMGALYTFLEDENPNTVQDFWTHKKLNYALGVPQELEPDPELYTFFLHTGIAFTPSWEQSLDHLTDTEYFSKRMEMLRTLTPPSLTK